MSTHPLETTFATKEMQEQPNASGSSFADEADFDKFATLFSPATPRGSPILAPLDAPTRSDVPSSSVGQHTPSRGRPFPHPRQNAVRRSSTDADSEFGSFVSVSAAEDPLSPFSAIDESSPSAAALQAPIRPSSSSKPNSLASDPLSQNASLDYFGKFGQDAKRASEKNKRVVLDELLMHEDDPLYWLSTEAEQQPVSAKTDKGSSDSEFGEMVGATDNDTASASPPKGIVQSLLDLDLDFFLPNTPQPTDENRPPDPFSPQSSPSTSPTRRHTRSATSSLPSPIRRRSSSLHPPTLAPPVASTSSVVSRSPTSSTSPLSDANAHVDRGTPLRSSSYQTLSTISSRWMSSLLPSSGDVKSGPPGGSGPSLESLFAPLTTTATSSAQDTSKRSRSTTPVRHPGPPLHSSTLGFPAFSSSPAVQISHGSPFAPPPQNGASPFAAHIFIPPTGAPGFTGEGYDWDKGYSLELERELAEGHGDLPPQALGEGAGMGPSRNQSGVGKAGNGTAVRELQDVRGFVRPSTPGNGGNGAVGGVGELIEKKSGSVQLLGRREMTDIVLTVAIADVIRPHLPALSRLPRTWNLIYSLDQHGISLNTLYTRCELPPQTLMSPKPKSTAVGLGAPTKAGALVVLRDAGDAVFGAWMSEGIHPCRGKGYYGSGESFLWRFVNGQLEVFKWTGRNDYVALCESDYISFGGGDGQYGLYLDDTLLDGSSARCPTFDNAPLCSPAPQKAGAIPFECVGLEVWGVWS